MNLPACPICRCVRPVAARYFSGGRLYWSAHPNIPAPSPDPCPHLRAGFGPGISWCPAFSDALYPPPPRENTAEEVRQLFALFHSLGDNCEFGIAQRFAGVETLDLLRFASFFVDTKDRLRATLQALEQDFDGLGEPGSITCEVSDDLTSNWYAVRESRWNLLSHGLHDGVDRDPDRLTIRHTVALEFRRRKLLEDMVQAHRIFVWKSNAGDEETEVRRLAAFLRSRGPNLLLWVQVATPDRPPGLVENAGQGLLRGYISRFAHYDKASDCDFQSWLAVCWAASTAAGYLRELGEWSRGEPGERAHQPPDGPLEPVGLDAVATDVFPGSDLGRIAAIPRAIVDPDRGTIMHNGRLVRETLAPGEAVSDDLRLDQLRFPPIDKRVIVGFGAGAENPSHWQRRYLSAIARAAALFDPADMVLAVPRLQPWQTELLATQGLDKLPRVELAPGWRYYFQRVLYCEDGSRA